MRQHIQHSHAGVLDASEKEKNVDSYAAANSEKAVEGAIMQALEAARFAKVEKDIKGAGYGGGDGKKE
ncbi:hypothetical protein D5086_014665 [Populus alba]|uniref:Uncharacterized protein n=1 Tax=Populus alba TaxID=43335 RepID=A0ACC4BY37_POPAL